MELQPFQRLISTPLKSGDFGTKLDVSSPAIEGTKDP